MLRSPGVGCVFGAKVCPSANGGGAPTLLSVVNDRFDPPANLRPTGGGPPKGITGPLSNVPTRREQPFELERRGAKRARPFEPDNNRLSDIHGSAPRAPDGRTSDEYCLWAEGA
jgi:hypothetical protein